MSFPRTGGSEAGLNVAELAARVTRSGSDEHEPGKEGDGQSAGHGGRFGGASDVPAVRGASGVRASFLGGKGTRLGQDGGARLRNDRRLRRIAFVGRRIGLRN